MRTLLLGMGNPILSDDAVGVRLATDFKQRLGDVPGLDVVEECSVGGLGLLDVFAGYRRTIVLDSVRSVGGKPGAWYRFDAAALRDTQHLTNIHDVNLATALELGYRLGLALPTPTEISIFAVEVADNITFSASMTPALETAYSSYADAIFAEVCALLCAAGRATSLRGAPARG